jgi:hypothetical protein
MLRKSDRDCVPLESRSIHFRDIAQFRLVFKLLAPAWLLYDDLHCSSTSCAWSKECCTVEFKA